MKKVLYWSVVIPFGKSNEAKEAALTAKKMIKEKLYFDSLVKVIETDVID